MSMKGLTISEAALTLSTAPIWSTKITQPIVPESIRRGVPPCAISLPSTGSSTNTTSPNTDCAWLVIDTVPSPVASSKTTVS